MADAEKTLRELLDKVLDERGYNPRTVDIEGINTGGANFTSVLFLVKVSSPGKDDLKLFAKVASVNEVMRARMSADWLYSTERLVYGDLVKIYKDIEKELNVPEEHRYVFPKFYGCNPEMGKETIIMENLIESGYKPFNRFKSMDWEHASLAVENLAKFHALSFAFSKLYPEEFDKMTLDMKYQIGSGKSDHDEAAQKMFVKMIEDSVSLLPDDNQKNAVRGFLFNPKHHIGTFNGPIGKPVIGHGDYRMSNLLFKKQNDKTEVITVDYQTVNAGNPVADLIYFVMLGSDEEFRQQYMEKLFEHYYSSLSQALKRLTLEAAYVYPKSKFDKDLKELLPYSVMLGVMVLPVVTVEAESAPTVDGNANINDFVMKPNELYAQRFTGIVNDFMKFCSS